MTHKVIHSLWMAAKQIARPRSAEMTFVHHIPPAKSERVQREEDLVAEMGDRTVLEMHQANLRAQRRRGVMQISEAQLGDLLNLPRGCEVHAVNYTAETASIEVVVQGPMLRPVPAGACAPIISGPWQPGGNGTWSPEPEHVAPGWGPAIAAPLPFPVTE